MPRDAAANGKPRLTPQIQAKIGLQIAKAYEGILKQEVPSRFVELADRFEQAISQRK